MSKDRFSRAPNKASSNYLNAYRAKSDENSIPMPDLPLENFMGNNLLALIYLSPYELPHEYRAIRGWLQEVTDNSTSWRNKADAAIKIGNSLNQHKSNLHLNTINSLLDQGNCWLQYARDLGCPHAALLYADKLLDNIGMQVLLDIETDPLPTVVPKEGREPRDLPQKVTKEWLSAIHIGLLATKDKFIEWTREDFQSCITCIVNYLCLIPVVKKASNLQATNPSNEWQRSAGSTRCGIACLMR